MLDKLIRKKNNHLVVFFFFFKCKSKGKSKCVRLTDALINNAKKCLRSLIQCEDLLMAEDPMGNFSEAILNYHEHYQDIHTSEWCRFHPKVHILNHT